MVASKGRDEVNIRSLGQMNVIGKTSDVIRIPKVVNDSVNIVVS